MYAIRSYYVEDAIGVRIKELPITPEKILNAIKKKLNLGPIDNTMAAEGEKLFESKCATCHKLDERYTGPAQRNVLQRVTPRNNFV